MSDTLTASWLGNIVNHQPPEKKTTEPVVHYTELDEAYNRVMNIYGPQELPRQRRRS